MVQLTCNTQNIKENIDGKPVDWYGDVFKLVFPDVSEAEANSLWKKELAKKDEDGGKDEEDSGLGLLG